MNYLIPRGLRSEIKLISTVRFSVFFKDIAFLSIWVCIFYFFQFLVSPWLVLFYWILCALSGFYLVRRAKRSNPEKRNWEAILLLTGKDHRIYRSINSSQPEKDEASKKSSGSESEKKSFPKKNKNSKSSKKVSRPPVTDHSVLESFPVRSWKSTVRENNKGYFILEDGSILDIFQITGRSYLHASEDEFQRRVESDTLFYRQYRADFKIVSMSYPTMLTKQKQYLLHRAEKEPSGPIRDTLLQKADTLDWLENNTTDRQIFFFLYAGDEHQYSDLLRIISRSSMNLQEISRGKKESVLWQLNNPCKQLRIQDIQHFTDEEENGLEME